MGSGALRYAPMCRTRAREMLASPSWPTPTMLLHPSLAALSECVMCSPCVPPTRTLARTGCVEAIQRMSAGFDSVQPDENFIEKVRWCSAPPSVLH